MEREIEMISVFFKEIGIGCFMLPYEAAILALRILNGNINTAEELSAYIDAAKKAGRAEDLNQQSGLIMLYGTLKQGAPELLFFALAFAEKVKWLEGEAKALSPATVVKKTAEAKKKSEPAKEPVAPKPEPTKKQPTPAAAAPAAEKAPVKIPKPVEVRPVVEKVTVEKPESITSIGGVETLPVEEGYIFPTGDDEHPIQKMFVMFKSPITPVGEKNPSLSYATVIVPKSGKEFHLWVKNSEYEKRKAAVDAAIAAPEKALEIAVEIVEKNGKNFPFFVA